MQRQTDIVALAEDNREDAAVRIGRAVFVPVRAGRNVRFFVRTRLNTRLIPSVCKGISVRAEIIVDEQKPVQRCLALAQRERFSKVLKHQVNRFRTICTVCGFVALS